MNSLRIEADEATAQVEEMKAKVKVLEQDNLQKEQEITSLTHKNGLLEAENEKLEAQIKDAKATADEGSQHGTQNEALQRRLTLLEEEAEEADKNLRETNDKYVLSLVYSGLYGEAIANGLCIGSVKPMSRPATSNAKSKPSSKTAINGRPSLRRWPRSMPPYKRNSRISNRRSATSEVLARWEGHDDDDVYAWNG
jgi:hypothetical protein